MAILGKIMAGTTTNDTVIYKVPTGKQATVNINAVNTGAGDATYTLSLIKNKDNTIQSLSIVSGGSGYSTIPTLSVVGTSTTTATAVVSTVRTKGVNVVAKGSGYFVGNVLLISGGTYSAVCRVTVLSVDGTGGILTASITEEGVYSAIPTSPSSHTGGQGTGATFSLTYAIETTTVTNKGNGYDTATITVTGDGTGASITPVYGVATEVTDAIDYNFTVGTYQTLERTGIPLSAGEMITASAGQTTINVTVYGIEELA